MWLLGVTMPLSNFCATASDNCGGRERRMFAAFRLNIQDRDNQCDLQRGGGVNRNTKHVLSLSRWRGPPVAADLQWPLHHAPTKSWSESNATFFVDIQQ
jgi:hypothetical protein